MRGNEVYGVRYVPGENDSGREVDVSSTVVCMNGDIKLPQQGQDWGACNDLPFHAYCLLPIGAWKP